MNIVQLDPGHVDRLVAFFGRLPDGDLTFIKEDVSAEAVRSWPGGRSRQFLALADDGEIAGYVAVLPLLGWSDHVGELRLVVDASRRGAGIGKALAKRAVIEAVSDGRRKVVVELAADQEPAILMFQSLGFEGEALLRDHIRDRNGALRDLVMLAHFVDDRLAALDAAGISEQIGA
jgi:L-amino acid N-acyltransferase YncA